MVKEKDKKLKLAADFNKEFDKIRRENWKDPKFIKVMKGLED